MARAARIADYRAGITAVIMANANRAKNTAVFTIGDFFPSLAITDDTAGTPAVDPDAGLLTIAEQMNTLFDGHDLRTFTVPE